MLGQRWRMIVLLVFCMGLIACPARLAVWIVDGSTTEVLRFGLGRERGRATAVQIGVLRVNRCGDVGSSNEIEKAVWLVYGSTRVSEIAYGVVPSGFTERAPARPLDAGCYVATVAGSPGRVRFEVLSDHAVREVT